MLDDVAEENFLLWPENERPLVVFSRLQTCWRYHPLGSRIGLDWPQVESVMRMMKISRAHWQEISDALRVLEAAELSEHG